jgi:hypothetical protein
MAKVVQTDFYCDCCLRKLELEALHHTMLFANAGFKKDTELDFCKTCLASRLSYQITTKIPRICQVCQGRGKIKGQLLSSDYNNEDFRWAVEKCSECWCCPDCPRILPEKWC